MIIKKVETCKQVPDITVILCLNFSIRCFHSNYMQLRTKSTKLPPTASKVLQWWWLADSPASVHNIESTKLPPTASKVLQWWWWIVLLQYTILWRQALINILSNMIAI